MKEYIAYRKMSVREFEVQCGLSNGAVSKMGENTRRSTVEQICERFSDINPTWLLTGSGRMLRGEDDVEITAQTIDGKQLTGRQRLIKYFPSVSAIMGTQSLSEAPDESFEWIMVPNMRMSRYAVPVFGNSMEPRIRSGYVVFLSDWKESFIEWGTVFMICTAGGYRGIKVLQPGSDNDHIKCCSYNEEYAPFEVPKSDIIHIYHVEGWLCQTAM